MRRGAGARPSETLRPRGDEPDQARPDHDQAPETGLGRVELWQRLVEERDEASAAAEMMKDARLRASAIVQEAEQKAAERYGAVVREDGTVDEEATAKLRASGQSGQS